MIRRALGIGGVVLAVAVGASVAGAGAPPGPRLAFVDWNGLTRTFALVTTDSRGHDVRRLAGGRFPAKVIEEAPFAYRPGETMGIMPMPIPPTWSPDGRRIVFSAWLVKPGKRWRYNWPARNFVAMADGSSPRTLSGLRGGYPVFAPDGRVVFARARRASSHPHAKNAEYSLWIGSLDGSARRQLTPWRYGVEDYPSSVSPGGDAVAVSRFDERNESAILGPAAVSAIAVPLDGGPSRVLADNAIDPVYSPDGARIAFTRMSRDRLLGLRADSIYVAAADGSSALKLTAGDEVEDTSPSWDPSGQRIAFVRSDRSGQRGEGLSIEQINADGTCEGTLFRERGTSLLAAPTWQPGSGREAGRIQCATG